MKKLILILLLLLLMPMKAHAESSSNDVYLRSDVFEAKMDAFMAEIRLMNEQTRREMDKRFNEIHAEMDKRFSEVNEKIGRLDERTEATKTSVYWGFAILGIVIVVAPAFLEYVRSLRKPHFTLDEVNQLITKRMEEFSTNFMKNIQEFSKGNIEFAGK